MANYVKQVYSAVMGFDSTTNSDEPKIRETLTVYFSDSPTPGLYSITQVNADFSCLISTPAWTLARVSVNITDPNGTVLAQKLWLPSSTYPCGESCLQTSGSIKFDGWAPNVDVPSGSSVNAVNLIWEDPHPQCGQQYTPSAFTGLEKLVNAVHRTAEDTGLADRLQTLKKKAMDRTVARIEGELGKVRQGHFPALDVGTGASRGLTRIFRHLIDATPI